MNTTQADKGFSEKSSFQGEIHDARIVTQSLLAATKNYTLYPPGHSLTEKILADFKGRLDSFFQRYGTLRLNIQKTSLFYQDEEIYTEQSQGEGLFFVFYRDGIDWIEFLEGITLEELSKFFIIFNEHRILQQNPEGDLVTSLWEADLPHFRYEVSERFWDEIELIDLSKTGLEGDGESEEDTGSLEAGGAQQVQQKGPQAKKDADDSTPTTNLSALDPEIFRLTDQEKAVLDSMIQDEEVESLMDDVLEVLIIILRDQTERNDFSSILEFILEESKEALREKNIRSVSKIFAELKEMGSRSQTGQPWRNFLVEGFFQELSSPTVLSVLYEIMPGIEEHHPELEMEIRHFLSLLQPPAISTLVPLCLRMRSRQLRMHLLEKTMILASQDILPLETLLENDDDAVVQLAIQLLGALKGKKGIRNVIETKDHPSPKVRREVMKALFRRDPKLLAEVYHYIDDSSETVSRHLLNFLGQSKDPKAEDLLLAYLEKKETGGENEKHIVACFRALGRCGSKKSIPFLQDALLKHGLRSVFKKGKNEFREGAAIALCELATDEARKILRAGSKSRYTPIRTACEEALSASASRKT